MTYPALETSIQGGAPLELYRFLVGGRDGALVPIPPAGGSVVAGESWAYADTDAATAVWVPANPGSLVGGNPAGGTAGSFTMENLAFIGGLGSGGGQVYHRRTFPELDPACVHRVATTITRSQATGFMRSGIRSVRAGFAKVYAIGGGAAPGYPLVLYARPEETGDLTIDYGWFIVEFGAGPIDLTFGPFSITAECDEGAPPEGFGSADGIPYGFTSAEIPVVYQGTTYEPAIIIRGPFRYSDDESRSMDLVIEVPRDHAIVGFAGRPAPAPPVSCTIYRLHRGDLTDAITPLATQVTRCEKIGAKARLTLTPVINLFDKKLPLEVIQKKCTNQLYGPVCQASRTGHEFPDLEVTEVDGRNITIAGLGVLAGIHLTRFTEGVLIGPDGSESSIEAFDAGSDTPDMVRLYAGNPAVVVGSIVSLLDGCLKDVGTCGTLFDNLVHHRGEPVMPSRNPGTGAGLN